MYTTFDKARNAIVVKESLPIHDNNDLKSKVTTVYVPEYTNIALRDALLHFMDTHPISDPIHIVVE